jgi:tetratricopeptide (TPR) repeat protein
LEGEHDNLRAALRWLTQYGHGNDALALAVAMFDLWYKRGEISEGVERLGAALELSTDGTPVRRAFALWFAGVFSRHAGDANRARTFHQAAFDAFLQAGHQKEQALVLGALAQIASEDGDLATARAYQDRSLALARESSDPRAIGWSLHGAGQIAELERDFAAAQHCYQESLDVRLQLAESDPWSVSWARIDHCACALRRQDVVAARDDLLACLLVLRGADTPPTVFAAGLETVGALAACLTRPDDALRLLGAAASVRTATGARNPGRLRERVAYWSSVAADQRGADATGDPFASGLAMTTEQAVRLAADVVDGMDLGSLPFPISPRISPTVKCAQ